MDGAHNAHGAQALVRALTDMRRRREAPVIVIVGMLARKHADSFIAALAGGADHVIATRLPQQHVAPERIAAEATILGVAASTSTTLEAAMRDAAARFVAPRVLICGSFALAAEALRLEGPSSTI